MLEKLLVRVRSWLHVDPATATAGAGSGVGSGVGAGPLVGPPMAPRSAPSPRPATLRPAAPTVTPPPLPGEAFGLAMEAQPESGMVITESGIIIIDPNAAEAETSASKRSDANDSAWALPAFSKAGAPPPPLPTDRTHDDWDSVLARARERLGPQTPGSNRK